MEDNKEEVLTICDTYQEWKAFEFEQRKLKKAVPNDMITITNTNAGYINQPAENLEIEPIVSRHLL